MTEQEIQTALDHLVDLFGSGQWELAFDTYYHEDLEKTDLDGVLVRGKAENLAIGKIAASKLAQVRDFSRVGQVVKGNRSFLVWSLDYDHANFGTIKLVQVAIQDWENGQIVRERFVA